MCIFIANKHQKTGYFFYVKNSEKKYFNLIIYFPTYSLLCSLIDFNKTKGLST